MTNKILQQLKRAQGFVSGEELSRQLNVSRTAVWKHINELRKDGYNIISSSKKGYRLVDRPDILDKRELFIPEGQQLGIEIIHFGEIDSTNNYAKQIANNGCRHGTVVVADKQTAGRGRVGRIWQSNNSEGLWFSVVLRPELEPEKIQIITLAASVAVVEAIRETQGIVCGIKWPNDIIIKGSKLGGILTELSAEPGHVNYVILGIGINVNQGAEVFDDEIRNKATSLRLHTNEPVSRVKLLGSILTKLEEIYNLIITQKFKQITDRWREHSVTIGKEVRITVRDMEYLGTAESIADDGRLIVKCKSGEMREVSSGEVQVRGLLGYI